MDGIDWMASAMGAARERLEIAAHNLANVSSTGFRAARARLRMTAGGIAVDRRTAAEQQGPLRRTGRPLDLALVGGGGFLVADPASGARALTRLGAFTRSAAGELVDARGRRLIGEHGPVRVGVNAVVESDGRISEGGRTVDRLRGMAPGAVVRNGYLEGSNANAVEEMIAVLDAQRAFETAQKTLVAIDEVREKAASGVARVPS